MIIRKVKVTEYEYQAPINYVAGATEPDIQFQLTDYEIPSGATGRVYVGRSDGTFEYTVATISGNNVTVAPTSSMFSVKGPGAIQVTLYVGNEVVKNFAVPVYVHADLADDSAEAGSDVTGVFRAAEEQALADFQEQAEEIAEEVRESIPADYTELTEEVSELNERFDDVPAEIKVNNAVLRGTLYDYENLFNQSDITDDYFVNATTGAILADSENKLSASGYVPVFGLSKLGIPNGVGQFAYYDVNKVYITGEQLPSVAHQYAEYTIPNNAFYARFTLYKSLKSTVYYKFPSADNDYTKGVVRYDFDTQLNETNKGRARTNIDAASSNTLSNSLNIELNNKMAVNTGTVTSGKYVNAGTGTLIDGSSTASDYLPVIPGIKVGISRGIGQFAFYGNDKTYISGVPVASTIHDYVEYDIPANAYYVRFTLSNSFTQSKMYYVISNGKENPLQPFVIVGTDDLKMPDFKRIRDAVTFAKQWNESTVFVQAGTYNLITEFAAEIAQSPTAQFGIGLSKGIHIIGESGSVITGNYDWGAGSPDLNIIDNFSPFYSEQADGGFTLENLTIQASNCRYCVHDEYSSGAYVSINKYINCNMYMNFTNAPEARANYYNQCIGGGLAQHSYVHITGCVFKTKAAESATKLAVSYHNAYTAGSQSRIIVEDSYFADHSTIRFGFYGLSELMSEAIVSNCSLGAEPFTRKEDPEQETPDNFTLIKWNNEIRT